MSKWIHPKTKTGDAVTGESYLRRPKINNLFWSHIEKGSDVLFVAPRRVGKTSIMKDLVATAPKKYFCIYKDVEGASTKNLFYKRVFEMLIQRLEGVKKYSKLFNNWVGKYEITNIGKDSVTIERKETDFQKAVIDVLNEVAKTDLTVILFVDEFVEVILKLRKARKQDEAISILHELREIRHNSDLKNIIFIYAGSIGLHSVVKEIGRPKLINDIEPLNIGSLKINETKQLIKQLTHDATIQYSEENIKYLINKINYLLPYFVQLMITEIDQIAHKNDIVEVDKYLIDRAFLNVTMNTASFDDWVKRLKDYQGKNFKFINSVLTFCAHKNIISIQKIYDLSVEYGKDEIYKDLIDDLVRDGYLVEENSNYRFLSPFLKNYWLHKNPILK
ncbi:MAG: hypothetical protein ACOCWG_01955 [bacterium]